MSGHTTTNLLNPIDDEYYDIDIGISGLIQKLWSLSINTKGSCQKDTNNMMWIQFNSPDYCKFMTMLSDYENDKDILLYEAIQDSDTKNHNMMTTFNVIDENFYVLDNYDDFRNDPDRPRAQVEINCNVWISDQFYPLVLEKINRL